MPDFDLDDLAGELAEFAPPEKKGGRSALEERVLAGFEDVQRFAETHGRAPQHGEDRDLFERLYAVRLDRLRALPEYHALLKPLDHQGLLAGPAPGSGAAASRSTRSGSVTSRAVLMSSLRSNRSKRSAWFPDLGSDQ